jgi:hypothetical protein
MAKYNLMDTEKPEYFDRNFDEEDDKKKAPKIDTEKSDEQSLPEMDDREYFDESLFTEETSPEEYSPDALTDIQIDKPQEQILAEEPINKTEPIKQMDEIPQAPPPPPKPDISDYDYEDSKIQGINWKPLFIWGTVFITIVAIVFFAYTWFFSNGEKEIAEQKSTISPQEQMRLEQEKKKIAFIKNVVAEKTSKLNNFSSLSNLNISNISYSSALLYGNSFKFEIFGQSRDDIAKYNQNLKKNNYENKFKIITVDTRPGSNGGLFALYNVESGISEKVSPQSDPEIDGNIQSTVKDLIGRNGLKINTDRIINRKNVDQFELIRNEITCTGTEANCIKFLDSLKTLNSNFNVHKISLIPTNQKNIKTSKYKLLVVYDFYI